MLASAGNAQPVENAEQSEGRSTAIQDQPVSRKPPQAIHRTASRPAPPQFRRAVKRDVKVRLAISGPSGSGKTYTLLKLATELGGPIALVDTERGSADKYADLFEFDTLPLGSFSPDLIPRLIEAAVAQGYRTLIIDSLSHFWSGTDGELDQVERVKRRLRDNGFAAWREVTPKHNRMIDAMLSAPIHVLVSMRVKTEWVLKKMKQLERRSRGRLACSRSCGKASNTNSTYVGTWIKRIPSISPNRDALSYRVRCFKSLVGS